MTPRNYLPLPQVANEDALRAVVLAQLERYFHVEEEVPGMHFTGKALQIDAILRPRNPAGWKDPDPKFGVEFKAAGSRGPGHGEGWKDYIAWSAQAVDYAQTNWDGYGFLRVFMCPGPTQAAPRYFGRSDKETEISAISRLLWSLGVGELARVQRLGWTLLGQQWHQLWSEHHGVREAKRWSLAPQYGSR